MDDLRGAARNLSSETEPWSARDQGFLLPASTWRDPPMTKPVLPGDIGLKGREAWMPRCQLAADLVGQRQSGLENRRNRMPLFPFEAGAAGYSRMRTSETTAKHSEHSLLLLAVSGCYFAAEFTKKRGFLRQT
jgi:hypothetical protein